MRRLTVLLFGVMPLVACSGDGGESADESCASRTLELTEDEVSLSPVNRDVLESGPLLRLSFGSERSAEEFSSIDRTRPDVFNDLGIEQSTRRRDAPGWILRFPSESLRDDAGCWFLEEGINWWDITEVTNAVVPEA